MNGTDNGGSTPFLKQTIVVSAVLLICTAKANPRQACQVRRNALPFFRAAPLLASRTGQRPHYSVDHRGRETKGFQCSLRTAADRNMTKLLPG